MPRQASITGLVCLALFVAATTARADDPEKAPEPQEPAPEAVSDIPLPVEPGHFQYFLSHSPFVRTLNLEETFALRGLAEIDGVQVATLYNRQTKKSVIVTASEINAERMQLKSVSGADFLNDISASIAVADDVMNLKFDPERIAPLPAKGGASSGSSGSSSKSSSETRSGPSSKDLATYKALPSEKQEKLREYIRQSSQKFPNMSREERSTLISGALNRLSEGGDITLPGASAPAAQPAATK